MMTKSSDPGPEDLRQQAEARLQSRPGAMAASDANVRRLMHELQVHQIELEMQNDALRQIQSDMQDALKRYADLNDHLEETIATRTADLALAREAAESANRAKSAFLANMSHELRTPMNAIMGLSDLALRRSTDPKQQDQLNKIIRASRSLLSIINDILDISKIEAERMTLDQVDFRLKDVLHDLHALISFDAANKGLGLSVKLPAEVGSMNLLGDPMRLGQILLNLTSNAIKFTASGTITINIACLEESPDRVMLRFEVTDTGIGITAENQQRLFQAFEQLDNSHTRKYGGTGLGLAISKRLVRLMGGDIGVNSAPGTGSTFWFTVRLGKGHAALGPPPAGPETNAEAELKARHAHARILLAEDEPINREVLQGLLEDAGLQIVTADDGMEAIDKAAHQAFDLILMDIQMPRLNGIEATIAIRNMPEHRHTPIIALTANAFNEDRQTCLEAGMDDHLGKPVEPGKLFNTLLKWLSAQREMAGH
jgi:signal transduction histidine kinase/ActR/RegA family two-component response regulator